MQTSHNIQILSLGFARGLWHETGGEGDTLVRQQAYAKQVEALHIVVHAARRHKLPSPRQLAPNLWIYATNGHNTLHSWQRMLQLGLQLGRTHAFQLVQTQDPLFSGTIALQLRRTLGVPLNVCVYGANPFDPHWVAESTRNRLLGPLARQVLRLADGVQVDGLATQRALVTAGIAAERIAYKPMVPANLATFAQAQPDPALRSLLSANSRYSTLALFVGRLVPQKQLGLLLQAAARLAPTCPHLRWVCVGSGPERAWLEAETKRLGLEERVLWYGSLPHTAIPALMASCSLLALPSRYEGFARVLMEAAAAGLPIVTTAVSGADEAVRPGESGAIVPIGDAAAFAAAVAALVHNPVRAAQQGRCGREHILGWLHPHRDLYRQVEIWQALCTRHNQPTPAVLP